MREIVSGEGVRQRWLFAAALAIAALALPAVAFGHLERPSYWPDPRPDMAGGVPTGGEVPKARSLASAVTGKGPGEVRVVCQQKSLRKAMRSIRGARTDGFRLRPSLPRKQISAKKARFLKQANRKFFRRCETDSIQTAINRSGNNDRVVVMPGRYTEPFSRQQPVNDPKCDPEYIQLDQSGAETPSYEYQVKCPHDQNLIYVQGRALTGEPLAEPDPNRHGIPEQELGRCIKCNLQIEGSGARPEDVIMDAGQGYERPGKPGSRPGGATPPEECLTGPTGSDNPCFARHVVFRADRADGFVGRNFLMKGAREHGFYTEESDGVLLDKVKFYWNADYGHLSFTSDHHVVKNCDGYGSGDSVVYPGAAPQTGEFHNTQFYGPESRYNTVIKKCDLHGSAMGYSGSMGNSVRVTRNRLYGNANGLTSDTLSSAGHPGFPADGQKVDRNWFYSNNLDVYSEDAPFEALVPQAIGTGIMWPGMNDGIFTKNRVFDNWRQGTFLIAIPDEVAGETEGNADGQIHCPESAAASTSCDNRYFANVMGKVPKAFKRHPGLKRFGNESGALDEGGVPAVLPNGVDFWWDEYPTSDNNCWYDNKGPDGTRGSLTADPPMNPLAGQSIPGTLPENCATSIGNPVAYGVKAVELLACFAEWEARGTPVGAPAGPCPWYDMPARPGTAAFREQQREEAQRQREIAKTPEAKRITEWAQAMADELEAQSDD